MPLNDRLNRLAQLRRQHAPVGAQEETLVVVTLRVVGPGKVELLDVAYNDVSLSIKSGDKISATTVLNPNGNFILSGPLYSREFSLVSSHKLQAFSASKVGCSSNKGPYWG